MLRCFVDENPQDWDVYAPALTYAYNMQVHRSTKTRPFDLILSRPPPDFTAHHNVETRQPIDGKDETFADRLKRTLTKARAALSKTQARYKKDFDKRVRKVTHKPKVGGFVFLDPEDGSGKRKKLQHDVEGPFKVLRVDVRTVVIQRGDVVERVSADRVAPAPAPKSDAPIEYPEAATPKDLAEKNIEGESWLVDSLIDHRKMRDGKLEFLVRWSGPYEDTWEPRANIPEELISRYFARYRRRDIPRKTRARKKANFIIRIPSPLGSR
ncbi:MAG: chromo domain-containing protein [Planctomycetota bacterium]